MSNNPTHDENGIPTWETIMSNLDNEIRHYEDNINRAVMLLLGMNK